MPEHVDILNHRTGQRMVFLDPGLADDVLRIECWSPSGPAREPEHVHPEQESRFEVVSGTLKFTVDGVDLEAGPSDVVTVPRGVPHRFWNASAEDAHYFQEFRPPLEARRFFEVFFRLANEGKLNDRGMPALLHLPVLVETFSREIRTSSPPWPITRLTTVILRPIARLWGYKSVRDL